MHVVLVNPEIAPNTGAIIRLCANTGSSLHLVEPLGFDLDDRLLKRGGLDYHEYASVTVHASLDEVMAALPGRHFGFSSRAVRRYTDVTFAPDDVLIFGTERSGLSDTDRALLDSSQLLLIPMQAESRSLNLANAVSVVVYEAWRQLGFPGAAPTATTAGLTAETIASPPFDS